MARQRLQSTTSQSMRRAQTRETQCSEGGEKTQPEDTRGDASGVRDQLPTQYSTSGPMPRALSASSGSTSEHSHLTAICIRCSICWMVGGTGHSDVVVALVVRSSRMVSQQCAWDLRRYIKEALAAIMAAMPGNETERNGTKLNEKPSIYKHNGTVWNSTERYAAVS
jgi:hypothetical protein